MFITILEIDGRDGYMDKKINKDKNCNKIKNNFSPKRKIDVFISSKCGDEKYDNVRKKLKEAIESTNLENVYFFEGEGASTLSASNHFTFALEDSDLCIFLIDNEDGIPNGVQSEIDTVNKNNIKALYYFCDETKKDKTPLQQSLTGAKYAKSKTVHSFDDLSTDGAQDLIDDILNIYHYYCEDKICVKSIEENDNQPVELNGTQEFHISTMPKIVIENIDKTRDGILKFVCGYIKKDIIDEEEKTSDFDEWGFKFLSVLLDGKSIKDFNSSMFFDLLKSHQNKNYFQVIQIRWQAIQAYFTNDIERCVKYIEEALELAKKANLPSWLIKDILIDSRNRHWELCAINNCYYESIAQDELSNSEEELYYPLLDRIHESLDKEYINGLYKNTIESPYTVTLDSNLQQYGELLASSLIISMYNGSLSHILLFYDRLKDFSFYLTTKYKEWASKFTLLKLAILTGNEKEITKVQGAYPEVLNNLDYIEAKSVMKFCLNNRLKYKRLNSQLLALGLVGYLLNDEDFEYYKNLLFKEIDLCLNDFNSIRNIGQSVFTSLSGIAYRLSQDFLSEFCCNFFDKKYIVFYRKTFEFISNHIDISKMSNDSARIFVNHIINILDDEEGRKELKCYPNCLFVLRKQNKDLTETMDKKISLYLPDFYNDIYKMQTSENEEDLISFIINYINKIRTNNEIQGKNGTYFGYGARNIATVRSLLFLSKNRCDLSIMDELILVLSNTILYSKESISNKLDAISLLIAIVLKYPTDYKRNLNVFEKLYDNQDSIDVGEHSIYFSNVDKVSLKIGLQFLFVAMGKDVYSNLLELMPYIKDDLSTSIVVAKILRDYLDISDTVMLPPKIDSLVLQNVLNWICSKNLDLRFISTCILIKLGKNKEYSSVVSNEMLKLIDSDGLNIKNLIIQHINYIEWSTPDTKDYILFKCKQDANFVVRKVCAEIEEIEY